MNYDLGGTLFIVFFVALGLSVSFLRGRRIDYQEAG
jgi:hypothetical protein